MFKGKKAVVRVSLIILSIFLLAFSVAMVMPAAGEIGILNTHVSTITVDPNIVAGGINDPDQEFNVEVCNNDGGNDIHEFRIYYEWEDFTNFTDVKCQGKTGWDLVILNTLWGHACVYSSTDNSYNIKGGYCKDFKFTAETPEEECCRELRFETRDINDFWIYTDTDVCVDARAPTIEKSFSPEGTYKIDGNLEWIDTATYITIDYTDPEPHPSGVVEKKYINLLSSDLIKRFDINDCEDKDRPCWDIDFCEENLKRYAEQIPDEEWTDYTEPFQKEDESCHILYMKAKDGVGNENLSINCFFVDKTPPEMDKTIGDPNIPCEPIGEPYCDGIPESESCYYYDFDQCMNIPGCGWIDGPNGDVIFLNGNGIGHCVGTPIPSCLELEESWQGKCDETPGCYWVEPEPECDYWVRDHVTPIILNCTDPEPHPSGDEEVCYKVSYDLPEKWTDITDQYCPEELELIEQEGHEGDWCCVDAPETIIFEEDSLHDLEYFCRDAVGKKSGIDLELFKVDSQPPIITKTMIGDDHLGDCPPIESGDECYVADDGNNGVRIDVEDDDTYEGCDVGVDYCNYGLWWYTSEAECSDKYPHAQYDQGKCAVDSGSFSDYKEIIFREDSTHDLVIYCWDKLGNKMPQDLETFLVDSTPPETIKVYEGPQYPNPTTEGVTPYPHWISSQTLIYLNATDNKVGVDKIYWRNTIIDNRYCFTEYSGCQNAPPGIGDFNEYTAPFNKPNESCHLIEYYAVDLLGNEETIKKQCVFVENTAPTSSKEIGIPKQIINDKTYITKDTPITLSCEDLGEHPVDHVSLWYRYRISDDCENWGDWIDWIDPDGQIVEKTIYFTEDSCHELEYYCVDALGNEEGHKYEIDIVDTQAPEITKEIIGPKSGDCPPKPGTDDICFIDGVTVINIEATDPEPHPVGGVVCEWAYTLEDGSFYGWYDTFPIQFPEETRHDLMIKCVDALGNGEDDQYWDYETFYVDKTPPSIIKEYKKGDPYYTDGTSEWINDKTTIMITVEDEGVHKSGLKETKYRYDIVDDGYCNGTLICEEAVTTKDWTTLDDPAYGEFSIPEDSCHLIEIYAEDNVGKNSTHKQCVFVDNKPPTPLKTIDEPVTEWYPVDVADDPFNPDATHFYGEDNEEKNIVPLCWNNEEDEIECWKITTDTKISMDCEDPQPHPVDNEKVCFNVELDAEDKTEGYCWWYKGDYIYDEEEEEHYCCVDHAIEHFYFKEESEHNLKYYCEDALGNKGPVDEEKFKVIGKMFKIRINDKWNLISVPFVLLNDNPKEVFKNTESVQTVWGYNGETGKWSVYRPENELEVMNGDGDGSTNNLESIEPGYGYWVLADCEAMNDEIFTVEDFRGGCGPDGDKCEMLIVGGSLYNPGPVVPPQVNLVEGWNLIGYYGTEGRWRYVGPDGFYFIKDTKEAYCALYSLRNLEGSLLNPTKWSALVGYWEPDNPNAWYEYGWCDEMDPGAGYWLSMDAEGQYKPSTICEDSILNVLCYIEDIFD